MQKELIQNPEVTAEMPHKYLGVLGMVWVTFLLLTVFTTVKSFDLFGFTFLAAALGYPITYVFSDIFTEVYGYRVSRKIIWSGFVCVALATLFAYLYTLVPPSHYFSEIDNNSFNYIFRASPAIAFATIAGFWAGELTNSIVLAKMKVFTQGRKQGLRYILSTLFGQIMDNTVAVTVILLVSSIFSAKEAYSAAITTIVFCTLWELLALPVTRIVIRFIKEREGIDTYDHGTIFNPFKFS